MKQKTAVEWFAEIVSKMGYVSTDILEQAKEMERMQIQEAFDSFETDVFEDGQEYYEHTYGK